MNPGRFFIPNINTYPITRIGFNPFMRNGILSNSNGILTRLLRSFRRFDWKNLLSGANKTLNVVNQTIPLIRQAKPMVNNVKSMVALAKAFGNETNKTFTKNNNIHKEYSKTNQQSNSSKTINSHNYPTFFV